MDQKIRQRLKLGLELGFNDFVASVECNAVSMTYPGVEKPALESVTFGVTAGSSIAFVGATGSGKSTLSDVVLGVLEPSSGTVSIGGLRPSTAVLRWPGAIAYVPQETTVVSGDVRRNVALGLPVDMIDDRRVWEALERSSLGSFLRSQRDGLNTVVGEHGMRLSGGQRQRLGIARALYTRPSLLVLDEATSALDAETEDAIGKTLRELSGVVTLVIVAHRLATIRDVDQVAFLSGGRIQAIGTFSEVRRAAPEFDNQATLLGL